MRLRFLRSVTRFIEPFFYASVETNSVTLTSRCPRFNRLVVFYHHPGNIIMGFRRLALRENPVLRMVNGDTLGSLIVIKYAPR